MSKANNLKDFLTDLANSIRSNRGWTGNINAQDFSSKITLQSKTVTLNNSGGTISPDADKYGLLSAEITVKSGDMTVKGTTPVITTAWDSTNNKLNITATAPAPTAVTTTAGWVSSVTKNAGTSGTSSIAKATFSASGSSIKSATAGYIPANVTVGTVSSGSATGNAGTLTYKSIAQDTTNKKKFTITGTVNAPAPTVSAGYITAGTAGSSVDRTMAITLTDQQLQDAVGGGSATGVAGSLSKTSYTQDSTDKKKFNISTTVSAPAPSVTAGYISAGTAGTGVARSTSITITAAQAQAAVGSGSATGVAGSLTYKSLSQDSTNKKKFTVTSTVSAPAPTISAGYISTGTAGAGVDRSVTITLSDAQAQAAVGSGSATGVAGSLSETTYTQDSTNKNKFNISTKVSAPAPTISAGYISTGTAGSSVARSTSITITNGEAQAIVGTSSMSTENAGTNQGTLTPSTSTKYVSVTAGYTSAKKYTINGDANLVAGNIKSGTSIFGVEGTFTSDATAAAANIDSGKTAYVNGAKVTGTSTKITPSGTVNITTTNTVNVSAYASAKVSDTNLVAGNIKAGTSILGIEGTFTSDATAAAGTIVSGKTAYVNGSKVTGTFAGETKTATPSTSAQTITPSSGKYLSSVTVNAMPSGALTTATINSTTGVVSYGVTTSGYLAAVSKTLALTTKGAQTFTPTTSSQTIAAGRYLTGVQTIKGDANLIEENIRQGITIFGIEGSYGGDASGNAVINKVIDGGNINASAGCTWVSEHNVTSSASEIYNFNWLSGSKYYIQATTFTKTGSDATDPSLTVEAYNSTSGAYQAIATISYSQAETGTYTTSQVTLNGTYDKIRFTRTTSGSQYINGWYSLQVFCVIDSTGNYYVASSDGTNPYDISTFKYANILKGTITNNATSGTATAVINSGKYIKIGAGYYKNDLYYQAASIPTLSGTASAADVRSGKTFYNTSTTAVTGTMADGVLKTASVNTSTGVVSYGVSTSGYIAAVNKTLSLTTKGAQTYTPTTSNQTIAAGKYLTGVQTIKGDANLVASNIKSGTSIFGVTGTFEGSSGGIDGITDYGDYIQISTSNKLFVFQTSGSNTVASDVGTVVLNDNGGGTWSSPNLVASNIKSGVNILGVTGTYTGGIGGITLNTDGSINVNCTEQTIHIVGYDNILSVEQDSSIVLDYGTIDITSNAAQVDCPNLDAGNIKSGVTILGITGTYSGSGGGMTSVSSTATMDSYLSSSSNAGKYYLYTGTTGVSSNGNYYVNGGIYTYTA